MALQKQVVRMSAEGGLDTKTDDKSVLPTNFLELENIVFTKTGAFSKRNGYEAFTKAVLDADTAISDGSAVTTFKDELLRYSGSKFYSYSPSESSWVDKGDTNLALASEQSIVVNGDRLVAPCHDVYENLACYVYLRDAIITDSIDYIVMDNNTGAIVATGTCGSGSSPSVVANAGKFYIFYTSGSDLLVRSVSISDPSTISSATTVFNNFYYAAEKIGTRIYVVSPSTTTGLNVLYIDSNGTLSSPVAISDALSYDRVAISAEQNTSVRITYGALGGSAVKTILMAQDLNYQIHAPLTMLSGSASVTTLGSVQDPTDVNSSQIYVSNQNAPYTLKRYVVTSSGSISHAATVINQATLQSKPQVYNNKVYFAVCQTSSKLPTSPFRTYFLVSEDGEFMCRYGLDAGTVLGPTLPRLNVESESLAFTGVEAAELQADVSSGNLQVPTVIKKYLANFNQTNNYFDATLGNNLHIAGGIMKMYDGTSVVEHGFLLTPPAPQLVSETTSGGVLFSGTFLYILVYKWIDKWGQVHRSAPSLPLEWTVNSTAKVPTIRLLTLPFTSKSNVELEIYRTEDGGTTFYRKATNFADRVMNDKTVESLTFDDTTPDAELIQGEALYTTGGALENTPASSSKHVSTYKSRVFALLSDGYTLQYSKKRGQNEPVEFAEELKINLDSFGGPGTCTQTLGDHLIIFKQDAIFALSGDGPNSLGEQDDYREPFKLPSDVGCVDANSLVVTPEGLLFKSSKGIYILGNNLAVAYIGAAVEAYNDLTITSATLIPGTNEVRFTTDSDRALVYDYYHKRWTTFTNINAVDATVFDGAYTFIRSNGDVMSETANAFSDAGSYIRTKLVSSWLQLAGIQGFQRFYKLLLLGSYKSAHKLRVKFAYDFNPAWLQETYIDAEALMDPTSYGDGVYGDSLYGGEFPLYQFRIYPERQKCQSFKFCIEDFQTSETGESLSLSNFAAEVGLKTSAYKKAANRSFGAS